MRENRANAGFIKILPEVKGFRGLHLNRMFFSLIHMIHKNRL